MTDQSAPTLNRAFNLPDSITSDAWWVTGTALAVAEAQRRFEVIARAPEGSDDERDDRGGNLDG